MAIGGVLFDIDGVLVTSWKPIDGAAETLRTLADNQIACAYLTNTTTRTRAQIAQLLTDAGMVVSPDEVITAAVLTADYVRSRYPDARCFLVNSGQIGEDMPGIDLVYSSEFSGPKAPERPDVVLLLPVEHAPAEERRVVRELARLALRRVEVAVAHLRRRHVGVRQRTRAHLSRLRRRGVAVGAALVLHAFPLQHEPKFVRVTRLPARRDHRRTALE